MISETVGKTLGNAAKSTPFRRDIHIDWMDVLWLLFLVGLAILPPINEIHKQMVLLAFGVVQLLEGRLLKLLPRRGPVYAVLLKLSLATLLIDHTEALGINSSYYPIFYLPVVTAALYFGAWGTLLWTLLAGAAYCSYLYPALQEYSLTAGGAAELALRILFFFLAAMVVNRFALENRRQTIRYRTLAEQLSETNRRLEIAQDEARRSERLAALGQLSAGLAHEIRNPLGVIRGSAEMLSEKLARADALPREMADNILSEVNRLGTLVTRFLDFARPLKAELRASELTGLLDQALDSVAENWHGGKVRVERAYQAGLPPVRLDEELCQRALLNLVQNAFEAMGEKGGTLRAGAMAANRNGHSGIELVIEDTGPGIPTELQDQIFNPFVTTKETGVGLGLSIVSKIIDGHGGAIRVESPPAGGARFVIFLPATSESVEPEAARKAG
ncbi:MAG: two-component system sensor histidine kinase NtrB [Candidatus Acidiferrales bacterium]